MKEGITIEICCGSLTDVLQAASVPETDRIELNCALELGGLTPSLQTFLAAKKTGLKIICMVRPRPAGFIYNNEEKETMTEDARIFLENGAGGIVFGCLNPDHTVDEEFTSAMTQLIHSHHAEAVFHKAFDAAGNQEEALKTLIRCGVDRVLTSGAQPDALTGSSLIHNLQDQYGKDIEILPGGGVTAANAMKIIRNTGCSQIHMTAKTSLEDDGSYYAVSADNIRRVLQTLHTGRRSMPAADHDMLRNDRYEERMYHHDEDDHEY